MSESIASRVSLQGGIQAPRYVFGTGHIFSPIPIHHALSLGYLAFDTAQSYSNEIHLGEAIRSYPHPIDREDLFIITKVAKPSTTIEETYEGIKKSVRDIGLGGYVDLFLVHNPGGGQEGRRKMWLALERAKKEGLTRAIGVSNFDVHHLEGMREYATEMPAVNQMELSPFNQDENITSWCIQRNIQLQAYAPVARGKKRDDKTLQQVCKEAGRSWNHVMLRYAWQKGYMITCKSETPERITDNTLIFDFVLSQDQMNRLDGLDCGFRAGLEYPDAPREYIP